MSAEMPIGPNVKRLIMERMAQIAVPAGGGMSDALAVLTDATRLVATGKEASEWVRQAIAVVKTAPDNPYGEDDEAIAGELLRRVEERRTGGKRL
jgi:hypothetical protein